MAAASQAKAGVVASIALAAAFGPSSARAQDLDAARAAYDRGVRAMQSRDFPTAAREFQTADDLAPNPVALRSAIVAATEANDAVLAMNLSTRAASGRDKSEQADQSLQDALATAKARFGSRVGRLLLRCSVAEPCRAKVNGSPFATGSAQYVAPGSHTVEFIKPAGTERLVADVAAEAEVTLTAKPQRVATASAGASPEVADHSGAHPGWIVVGFVGTAALTGVTIWSAVDTVKMNDEYLSIRDQERYDAGLAAQLRTNILIGATAGSALATALFAAFGVNYSGSAQTVVAGPWLGPDDYGIAIRAAL